MKDRKPDEDDATYIARLEVAYSALRENNKRLSKAYRRVYEIANAAAPRASLILQLAAEMTGTADDDEVKSCIEALEKLATCGWHEDRIDIPPMPCLRDKPAKFFGDVEMIVKSALEKRKAQGGIWDRERDRIYAAIKPLADDADWREILWEVSDALSDLAFSRDCLRTDLRSGMHDYCYMRILQALRLADEKQGARSDEFPE